MEKWISKTSGDWLACVCKDLEYVGFAVVADVLDREFLRATREALYETKEKTIKAVGQDRLDRAGELGVLRLPMTFTPFFYKFLEIPELLKVVDSTLGSTAILHLQNGFVLPSFAVDEERSVFQNRFHPDFPRFLNGYLASVNIYFALEDFTKSNGAILVVPGTHQQKEAPASDYFAQRAQAVTCPAGSMVVFDSTLWHAAGINRSGKDRLAINHQFTRSFIKQQFDYVRAIGEPTIKTLPERTQQLLGYYTRVVTNLDEYYQPEDKRLYRKNQG